MAGLKGLFANSFDGTTVLVTGHTGFKGSWLVAWLKELGAKVVGYSLSEPPTTPSNFEVSKISRHLIDLRGDVRDLTVLQATLQEHKPQIVFHLAAQPIVLRSYKQPKLTFDTNVTGTLNVLEAIRTTNSVKALVCITTDKVYENKEWLWGYRENDALGGSDPYSASKAMAELAVASYRNSFVSEGDYDKHQIAIATVRAGNVIGGGDFAEYRLVPDCMRSLMDGKPILVRNPHSIRPWQHVLEPLSGYLLLAAKLMKEGPAYAQAWNFGPLETVGETAGNLAQKLTALWESSAQTYSPSHEGHMETGQLRLSWEKAARRLNWRPVYNLDEALAEIIDWFQAFQNRDDMYKVCREHIERYVQRAYELDLDWAIGMQRQ
jgi:CDP-glucose 4,6-dehydratase